MSLLDNLVTVDFESKKIDGALPPKPVGVSIKMPFKPSKYYAWGHPDGNNCSESTAKSILANVFKNSLVLFHNASFDIAVAKHHLGIPFPKQIHDTLLLLFLANPHAKTLSLKPSADKILNRPPAERDELHDWILRNVVGANKGNAGAYISEAPGNLVDPYACADTDMTWELFCEIYEDNNGPAYEREIKLLPILTQNTLDGIRLNEDILYVDYMKYSAIRTKIEDRIYAKLGARFNINAGAELAKAVDNAYDDISWLKTKTGKNSTNKASIAQAINDPELVALLNYRATITTFIDTFFSSWINKAVSGRLHFGWNQVRNNETGGFSGTRTGRLSSNPSMLNVPSRNVVIPPGFDLPPLPVMKRYFLPEYGQTWFENDFSSQEIRVLAHYDDDTLMRAFQLDPSLDMHAMMSELLTNTTGKHLSRLAAKTTAFSILYGSGLAKLAEGLGVTESEARFIKTSYLQAVPGVKQIQTSIKETWASGQPIQTWGGRKYYKEESKVIEDKVSGNPRTVDFGYKGLNYLIQGSSADITKQAIINYNEIKNQDARFLLSVHDSINISGRDASELKLLTEAMTDIKIDVPMTVDSKYGPSYGDLTEYTE